MDVKESKRGQKLYYYLSRLSPKELKDLHAYFSSPLLGNSLQMARMLLTIQAEVLDKGGKVIDAELFQTEFFPDQALDDNKRKYIRIRLVQFLERVLDFVAFMEYKGDTNAHHVHLLKAMHTRGWEKYFERTYQEIEAMPPKKDFGEYHLYRMRREIVRNDHLSGNASIASETNLPKTIERIDNYIIFIALKYACAAMTQKILGKIEIETKFDQIASQYANQDSYQDNIEVVAYTHSYRMLCAYINGEHEGDLHFDCLSEILNNPATLDRSEAYDLFSLASNYCQLQIRAGKFEYIARLRDVYTTALAKGTITNSGIISRYTYRAIVNQMCKVGEVQWSANFVEEWKYRIGGDTDHLTYYVTKAYIHLLAKDLDKAIELLYNRIALIEDVNLSINARTYLCRAVWEKGDFQWLNSILEAFRLFLIRCKSMSKPEKLSYERYLEIFTKMCAAQLGNPDLVRKKLERLKVSIEENGETQRYFWLNKTLLTALESLNTSKTR
jgi:hypothetical protein